MPTNQQKTTDEPKQPSATTKGPKEKTLANTIKTILESLGKKLETGDAKASVGEYIRLLQIQKELGEEPKTAMRVTWIEEPETSEE